MHDMYSQPGLFEPDPRKTDQAKPRPATARQIAFAKRIAKRTGLELSPALFADRAALSGWIDRNLHTPGNARFSAYPSSKQVAFAERIATIKRRAIPEECLRDRTLLSRWIDHNKP